MMRNCEGLWEIRIYRSTSRSTSQIWSSLLPTAREPKHWENSWGTPNYSPNPFSAPLESMKFLAWWQRDKLLRGKLRRKQCCRPFQWQDWRKTQCLRLFPFGVIKSHRMVYFPWTCTSIRASSIAENWKIVWRRSLLKWSTWSASTSTRSTETSIYSHNWSSFLDLDLRRPLFFWKGWNRTAQRYWVAQE